MSSPLTRSPLQEQSRSEINRLAIRVVPYSPPRILHTQDIPNSSLKETGSSGAATFLYHDQKHSAEAANRSCPAGEDSYLESSIYRPTTSSSCSSKRAKKVINVHPDKTFTVIQQREDAGPGNSTTPSSELAKKRQLPQIPRLDFDIQFPESAVLTPIKPELTPQSSPWNYDFIGGVRKVQQPTSEASFEQCESKKATSGQRPVSNSSMQSSIAASFATMDTNVKVIGAKSDVSSSQHRPATGESEPNIVRHGSLHSYPSFESVLTNQIRASYSKESLKVAPLRLAGTPSGNSEGLPGGETSSDPNQDVFARHPWAAPLSTIFSDSEEGSDRFSRSLSPTWTDTTERRQSKQSRMDTLLSEVSEVMESENISKSHMSRVPTERASATDNNTYELDEVSDILTDLKIFSNRSGRTISHVSSQNEKVTQTTALFRPSSATNMAIPSWAK